MPATPSRMTEGCPNKSVCAGPEGSARPGGWGSASAIEAGSNGLRTILLLRALPRSRGATNRRCPTLADVAPGSAPAQPPGRS